MILNKQRERQVLYGLLAVLAAMTVYRIATYEKPRTAPLAFPPGSVATSTVRSGPVRPSAADPILLLLGKREEKYPGVQRDLFRMENPVPRAKTAPASAQVQIAPPVPQKTPEELAAEAARADLAKFRFLGYVAERAGRESSLFLSKEDELFIVKIGDKVQKNYVVKGAGKDHVVLLDTATRVEVRVELSGGAEQPGKQVPGRPQPPAP